MLAKFSFLGTQVEVMVVPVAYTQIMTVAEHIHHMPKANYQYTTDLGSYD